MSASAGFMKNFQAAASARADAEGYPSSLQLPYLGSRGNAAGSFRCRVSLLDSPRQNSLDASPNFSPAISAFCCRKRRTVASANSSVVLQSQAGGAMAAIPGNSLHDPWSAN